MIDENPSSELQACRNEYKRARKDNLGSMDETQQDFHEETKQDTEPERRQSEDQD